MRQWLDRMRLKFQHWMIGRYGTDELSKTLMWAGIIMLIISWFRVTSFLVFPAWIAVIYAYYRCFSKNIVKRSRERDVYLRLTAKFRNKLDIYKRMWRERKTHRYFKCPQCKKMIRVPRGKGKIAISCRSCGHEIIKTT